MTSPNMGMLYATPHADDDIWGDILNSALDVIDAHDHTTGKGVPIPSAGLNINADVPWFSGGSQYAITGAKAFDFTPQAPASVSSYSSALFANSSDSNNLYYRNSSGTNVKITDGATLNVSIVGGIGGDYSSVGALLDYDDATDTYRFRQQSSAGVRQFAFASVGGVNLFEYKAAGDPSVPGNRVRLSSPAALAASYTLTFPGAVAASNGLFLQSTTAGVLSFSNTTGQDITANDFLFSGTQIVNIAPAAAEPQSIATGYLFTGNDWTVGTETGILTFPVQLQGSCTITAWSLFLTKTSAAGTVTAGLYKQANTGGAVTLIGSTSTNSANNPGSISLSQSGLTETYSTANSYFIKFTGGGTTGDTVRSAQVSIKRA